LTSRPFDSRLDETYGSLDAYLERALGVDAQRRDMLAERLLG